MKYCLIFLAACGAALTDPKSVAQEKCAGDARAEYYVGQKSADEAMAVYRDCMIREGFPGQ